MCTYMIMDVELFLQVLVFLDQLAPQEQRRLVEISQFNCQLTKVERVQSRMASSLVSLCVHGVVSSSLTPDSSTIYALQLLIASHKQFRGFWGQSPQF